MDVVSYEKVLRGLIEQFHFKESDRIDWKTDTTTTVEQRKH